MCPTITFLSDTAVRFLVSSNLDGQFALEHCWLAGKVAAMERSNIHFTFSNSSKLSFLAFSALGLLDCYL